MEPEGSLPHSQVPATSPYPEPDQSSPCPPTPNFLQIHNIILASTPGPSKWFPLPQVSTPKSCIHLPTSQRLSLIPVLQLANSGQATDSVPNTRLCSPSLASNREAVGHDTALGWERQLGGAVRTVNGSWTLRDPGHCRLHDQRRRAARLRSVVCRCMANDCGESGLIRLFYASRDVLIPHESHHEWNDVV